jgi:hypothetical protein
MLKTKAMPTSFHDWLCLIIGIIANIVGLLCVIWPVLPKHWRVGELVGRIFNASKDPSMGIQYMFFWLMTIPIGAGLSSFGVYIANGSERLASISAIAVVFGGVWFVQFMAKTK